jgi:hemolysin III
MENQVFICPVTGETPQEEKFNFITHLIGFLLSIFGSLYLFSKAWMNQNSIHIFTSAVYGGSLIALYGASTFYHRCKILSKKHVLKIVDHACIYLLIAGSYTPFTLGPLKDSGGWNLLIIEWVIAVVGITVKMFAINRFKVLSLLAYLFMGWLVMFSVFDLMNALSFWGFVWLISGGLIYSLGTLFYIWDSLPFNHGIWHLFVLGGSACHYFSILTVIYN